MTPSEYGTPLVLTYPYFWTSSNVAALYKAIPGAKDASSILGAGFYTVPCESIPSVSFTFNGQPFVISPETFNLGAASQGSSDCVGGITANSIGKDVWVVGGTCCPLSTTILDSDGCFHQMSFCGTPTLSLMLETPKLALLNWRKVEIFR